MDGYKLMFLTGLLAAFDYIPMLGYLLRRCGMVKYYDLMPEVRTTWTNTFDFFGSHEYQRIISSENSWLFSIESKISAWSAMSQAWFWRAKTED